MRRFTEHDQERFARFSGDWNPMHMDLIAARRTQAGEDGLSSAIVGPFFRTNQ